MDWLVEAGLTASQKIFANFGAKVATTIVASLSGYAINSYVQSLLRKGVDTSTMTKEEIVKINRRNLLIGCVVTGTCAGVGTVAFKGLSDMIESSDFNLDMEV